MSAITPESCPSWAGARSKAFGTNNYAPRRDGKPSYSEAWIFDGKELIAARVVRAPWLTQVTPSGDDVSLVLETKQGSIVFEIKPTIDAGISYQPSLFIG